jgi:nucleolar protein 4
VEFERHDHALAALRQLNNNPAAFSADRRPIVEFAMENVKVCGRARACGCECV